MKLANTAIPFASPRARRPRGILPRAAALALRMLTAAGALAVPSAWPASALAEEPPAAGVVLVIENAPWDVDTEAVREAIGREIGKAVTLADAKTAGRAALVLRGEAEGRVTLTYHAEDGRQTGRTIELPKDSRRVVETIALLAGNLVRDEAAELAATFGKRPAEAPASASAPAPAPAPAPAAAPASASASAPAPAENPAPCAAPGASFVLAGADFLPWVGTSTSTGTNVVRRYSANFIAGTTAGLAGIEVGIGVNLKSSFMCGVQGAAGGNIVAGPARGAQLTAGVNYSASLYGAQLGSLNIAAGPAAGAQVGVLDIAGPVTGAQLGALTIAAGDVTGAQLGVMNVATGKVKGVQLGLVNYADTSSLSIGLLNIIRNGRFHLDFWGMESGIVMAGLKHGSDYFHNIYGAGAVVYGDRPRVALTLGFGGRIPLGERLYADVDLLAYSLHDVPSLETSTVLGQTRILLGARLASWLAIYGGPSYNIAFSPDVKDSKLSPYGSIALDPDDPNPALGWPGVVLGVQLF